MSVTINLTQCRELLELFGGEDTEISIEYIEESERPGDGGHSGPGLYAWHTEYPDEGSVLLGEPDTVHKVHPDGSIPTLGVKAGDVFPPE